jgi:mannose-6-phosphate isomerase
VRAGDVMFLPSGRVHAIGAGLVIFEIQQNSDTTYRVFDWNRVDAKGNARPLHVAQSLECIDFQDFEPQPLRGEGIGCEVLLTDSLFTLKAATLAAGESMKYLLRTCVVVAAVEGTIHIPHENTPVTLRPGEFALVPAALGDVRIEATTSSRFLTAEPGEG